MSERARVLIVDDSRTFRAGLEAALTGEEGIAVAGSVFNGEKALDFIRATPPDLVTLDVDMPGMDGFQILQAIQQFNRGRPASAEVGVLMLSAFTRRGAEITVRALQAGAFDFVTKPSGASAEESIAQLKREVVPRVRLFMARRKKQQYPGSSIGIPAAPLPSATGQQRRGRNISAVLIGCSTGGPKALATLLPLIAAGVDAPIIVAQHMPAEFTKSLAESLARQSGLSVVEATDGMAIESRKTYIAPGGMHLVLRRDALGLLRAGTNEQPPESGCRPSASVLFRSAAAVLAGNAVAIVLTGMGNDGAAGLGPFKRAGGYVIAQDEATSVVWGMPGSAVAAGVVDEVLPLPAIASAVRGLSAPGGAS
jgi:two-component system chemotaxis response regulator CheB